MGKIVTGLSLLVLSLGIANAEELLVSISKYEDKDGKKTIMAKYMKVPEKGKGGKGAFGKDAFKDAESKTFTITKDVKVMKRGKFDFKTKETSEPTVLEDGLKNKMFTDASTDSPLRATIKTNDKGEVTEIMVGGGGGGKGKFNKKNDTSVE